MKKIPNILSITRIPLSVSLLFLKPFSILFYCMYLLCGVSDILDGYLARKLDCTSAFGSWLDSIADFLFFIVMALIFYQVLYLPIYLYTWVIVLLLIHFISLYIGYKKFNTFVIYHTYLNKIVGFMLFCIVFLYSIFSIDLITTIICIVATIASIENISIQIWMHDLHRDTKGIYDVMNERGKKLWRRQ